MSKAIIRWILLALALLTSSVVWACCGFDGGGYDDPFGASSSSPGAFMGGGSSFGGGGSPFGGGSSGPGMWGGGSRSGNPFGAPGIVDYRDSAPRDPFGYSAPKAPSRDSYYRAPERKPVSIGDIFSGFTREDKPAPGSGLGYSDRRSDSSIGAVLDGKGRDAHARRFPDYRSLDRVPESAPGTHYRASTPDFTRPSESGSVGAVLDGKSGRSGVPGVSDVREPASRTHTLTPGGLEVPSRSAIRADSGFSSADAYKEYLANSEPVSRMSSGYAAPRPDSVDAFMSGRSGRSHVPGVTSLRDVETRADSGFADVGEWRKEFAKSALAYSGMSPGYGGPKPDSVEAVATLGDSWEAQDITNEEIRRDGCTACARLIRRRIGGEIHTIRPTEEYGSRYITEYRGEDPGWYYHDVVVKDGMVFDGFGPAEGVPISAYQALFGERGKKLDFGF